MFEKILNELKTKYKNFGLSDTILKAKAKQIEKAVKEESEIEEAVAGVEDDLAIFQSFADQNRTLAKKLEELGKGKVEDPAPEKPVQELPAPTGDVPEWAKAIIESNKALTDNLTKLQQKEAQQTNAQKLQAKLTELEIPEKLQAVYLKRANFENEEQFNEIIAEAQETANGIAQHYGNASLGAAAKPLFGEAVKEGDVSPEVQALIDSKKPKTNE